MGQRDEKDASFVPGADPFPKPQLNHPVLSLGARGNGDEKSGRFLRTYYASGTILGIDSQLCKRRETETRY